MGMSGWLEVGGFCRVMVLLVCVQAEVSLTVLSKHRGVAGCVRQYYARAGGSQLVRRDGGLWVGASRSDRWATASYSPART
jgi:hypothetical protein